MRKVAIVGIQAFNYLIFHNLFLKWNQSVIELNEHRPSRLLQICFVDSYILASTLHWKFTTSSIHLNLGLCVAEFCWILIEQKVAMIHRGVLCSKTLRKQRQGICFNVKLEQMCHNPWLIDITLKAVRSLKNMNVFLRAPKGVQFNFVETSTGLI